jgi:hypothetical protein
MATATNSGGPFTGKQAASIIAADFCPYGAPGDRLWVREAWRACREADHLPPRDLTPAHRIWYEADQPALGLDGAGKYRPPMFMPRWACRLVLEIVSVRVERLKDISDDDAIAEGIECDEDGLWRDYAAGSDEAYVFPVGSFWSLWDSINGEGAHNANPWVWVVEFRRIP